MGMRTRIGSITAALLACTGLIAPQQASASTTTRYYSLVAYGSCGRIAPTRELTEATGGTLAASSSLVSWKFTIQNSTSRVHWQACGSAAPYGNYDIVANNLSQTFEFTVTAPQISSCSTPVGKCSGGVGTRTITATQSAARVGSLTNYLNGQSISALYPARLTVRASASVIAGAYGGSVTTSSAGWAF